MLFNNKTPTEEDILNQGIDLAMEFGQNWLQPIKDRLSAKYHFLTEEQLNYYNATCKLAMDESQRFLYDSLVELERHGETIMKAF